jgi:Cys-rich four helix bundle protein (predicted Tat secretion target)
MINRRDVLLAGAGAALVKITASTTACADSSKTTASDAKADSKSGKGAGDHAEHGGEHAGHDAHAGHGNEAMAKLAELCGHCSAMGEACLTHCITMLADGDKSMGDCAKSTQLMVPFCQAMTATATIDAKQVMQLVALCKEVCTECEAACAVHSKMHAACKRCEDSCKAVTAAISALG